MVSKQIYIAINLELTNFLASTFGVLNDSFHGFAVAFLTLYLIFAGYGVAKGTFKDATKEVLLSMALVVFIYTNFFQYEYYEYFIVKPIKGTILGLSTFFVSKGASGNILDVFEKLDQVFLNIIDTSARIQPQVGWGLGDTWIQLKAGAGLGLMMVAYAIPYVSFIAIMVLGMFSIQVLLVVGGICFFFASFKKTRFIFYSWLRGIINYGLLIVIASIAVAICIQGIETATADMARNAPSQGVFTMEYAFVLLWSVLCAILVLKSPDIAALLSGGMAGSTAAIAGGIAMVGGAVAGGLLSASSKAYNGGGKSALAGAGRLANKAADHALTREAGPVKAYSAMKGIDR